MEQCKATTRNGNPCWNNALSGSEYCHIKSHQPPIKHGLCKKAWHYIRTHRITTILVIIFPIFLATLGLISDTIQVHSFLTQDIIKYLREAIALILNNQEYIRNILVQQLKAKDDKLIKQYHLGYALFYADSKNIYAPYEVNKSLTINWDSARIISFTIDQIVIRFPKIIGPNRNLIEEGGAVLRRYAGNKLRMVQLLNICGTTEILINEKDYIVGVIGFGECIE